MFLPKFLLVFFCQCAQNTSEEKIQIDSIKTPEIVVPKISCDSTFPAELLKSGLKRWIDFYKNKYSTFKLTDFKFQRCSKENSLITHEYEPSKEYIDLYHTLLVYSPDNTSFIDMDSYNFLLEKDKKGNLIGMGGDPETEVALVNLREHTHTRLFYVGSFTIIEEVSWLNQSTLAIAYLTDEDNENAYRPNITIIDLNMKTFSYFQSPTKIDVKSMHDYSLKVRWKSIKIKE